jgi:ribosomal protein L11 methyltransferase
MTKRRAYLQFSVETDGEDLEQVERSLVEAGAMAVTFQALSTGPIIDVDPDDIPSGYKTRVIGLFDGQAEPKAIEEKLGPGAGREAWRDFRIEWLEERDWTRVWMDHFRPIRFGSRLRVCPGGYELPDVTDVVDIVIDPGLAFGTGTHPTTALCLEWLDGADLLGRSLIDYGCGSGILAVSAARLGAADVWAVDLDPQACDATRANADRNGVLSRVTVRHPDDLSGALRGTAVDILMANILSRPLIGLAGRFRDLVKQNGWVILSGILIEQEEEVTRSYAPYFDMEPAVLRAPWVRLAGRRRR